jgi:transcriptional regulator with XRE-family HTH domain
MPYSELRKILGDNLKARLKYLNYTQEKASDLAGISNGHFSDLLNGRSWPSDRVLERLAEVLQVHPYELFIPADSKEGAKRERMLQVETLLKEKITKLIHWGLKNFEQGGEVPPEV